MGCYGAVTWAMDAGIFSNPDWYPNLTSSSSFEDFQARLHSISHGNCPLPCRCLNPLSWRDGHYVKVHLQEGSATCADSATARVDYFVNNSDCSGTPYSSMVIPTTSGSELIDGCRDIYGNLWADYSCRARWDA